MERGEETQWHIENLNLGSCLKSVNFAKKDKAPIIKTLRVKKKKSFILSPQAKKKIKSSFREGSENENSAH